jgi:acetyltransferase
MILQIAADERNRVSTAGQRPSNATEWVMKDGTEVLVRSISPEDEPLMVKFHQTLSDRTVYLRYFCSLSFACRSSHERLARICFADPAHETVLVAIQRDVRMKQEKILGVGRLNKSADDKSAELAVLVSDEFQGRGLGKALVGRLIQAARDQHIARITAEMLRDNIPIQSALRRAGFRFKLDDPRIVRAVLEL